MSSKSKDHNKQIRKAREAREAQEWKRSIEQAKKSVTTPKPPPVIALSPSGEEEGVRPDRRRSSKTSFKVAPNATNILAVCDLCPCPFTQVDYSGCKTEEDRQKARATHTESGVITDSYLRFVKKTQPHSVWEELAIKAGKIKRARER